MSEPAARSRCGRPGSRDRDTADLNAALESTITVARNEWKYVADVVLDLDPDLPAVACYIGDLNQAFLNLIVNASHSSADVAVQNPGTSGTITVRTRLDGEMVEVRVEDTGMGIPEEVRPRVFEPFFTTKEVGRGTGQGLAVVYAAVVKRHGGTVTVESEVGRGSAFIVRTPLAADSGFRHEAA